MEQLTEGQQAVYELVCGGTRRANDIAEAIGKTPRTTRTILLRLNGKGLVRRVRNGRPRIDSVEWVSARVD